MPFAGQIEESLRFCQPEDHNYGKSLLNFICLYHCTNFPQTLFFPSFNQGQLDAHSDLHRSARIPTATSATEAGLGHPFIFHSRSYLAHLASFPSSFSQSPITIVTSSSTLCWAMFLLLPFLSLCCRGPRDDAGSVHFSITGSFKQVSSEVTTATILTVKNTIEWDQVRDRKTEFFNPFPPEGSTEQLQEDKGKWGERQVKNKCRYPSEGTDQIKSLWHFNLTDGCKGNGKSESNLLL